MKNSFYFTTQVLPGNRIEVEIPKSLEGQMVEVIILTSDNTNISSTKELSLEERRAFLKLPPTEKQRILQEQAENLLSHYQEDTEWRELMAGDIVEY
jgi:hypothetical protein